MTPLDATATLRKVAALRSLCRRLPHLSTSAERERLRRFEELVTHPNTATQDDVEALAAGWQAWWRQGRVDALHAMAARLPEDLIQRDRRLQALWTGSRLTVRAAAGGDRTASSRPRPIHRWGNAASASLDSSILSDHESEKSRTYERLRAGSLLAFMRQAPAGIGRRISRAVRGAFGLVLVVGGVSVLLAWTISASVDEVRAQSGEVEALDRIHVLIYQCVADLHLLLETGHVRTYQSPEETLGEITRRVAAYEARERAQGNAESSQELARLERLHTLVARLGAAARAAIETSQRGAQPSPSALAAINGVAHDETSRIMDELHAIHLRKFHGSAARTERRMLLISALYVLFAAGGGVFLFVADRFLSRRLVVPIARLGEAALRIARGDLSKRVSVRSSDEVGQLSQAFNLMAERLEAHEAERVTFEAELERQVKERTRDLEATTTRLHATQAQLIRAERIAVTGQIAAGVTHEIRTPLNSLAINVQLLRRELSSEDGPTPLRRELLEALVALEYEITRINRILEEFVNFARLPRPRFEPVEAVALIQEILALLGPQAARVGVRVEGPSRTAIATVRGDPDQLRQVFLNLAQNAVHAMGGGGGLFVEASRDGDWVEISVADSGPGVPAAERETIFLPFVSTKADGLGLGLPIVRRIVEAHGGTVGCRERAGGGAVFVVRLPASRADHED